MLRCPPWLFRTGFASMSLSHSAFSLRLPPLHYIYYIILLYLLLLLLLLLLNIF